MLNQFAPLDRVFHALSDPSRRRILEQLSRGPTSVTELARPLAMSLPAVVQHIGVLEASGLVHSEKKGRTRYCRIDSTNLNAAQHWIEQQRSEWEERLDRLDDYLDNQKQDSQ